MILYVSFINRRMRSSISSRNFSVTFFFVFVRMDILFLLYFCLSDSASFTANCSKQYAHSKSARPNLFQSKVSNLS